MTGSVLTPGGLAVVTGGASGIGFAACRRFAEAGMSVAIVDVAGERLEQAVASLAKAAPRVEIAGFAADVADRDAVHALASGIMERFGRVDLLMANAGVQPGSAILGPGENWDRILGVNLHGVITTVRAFLPAMIAASRPGTVIITGSKQGITTPPGDPAYNVAKAGVKAFAEAVEHELRSAPDRRLRAHLLIPGFVFTGLTANGRTEKPAAAWTPDEVIDYALPLIERGDFYILCPDNDVTRALDERRILWAAGDVIANRPPLSRWHPAHEGAFAAYLTSPDEEATRRALHHPELSSTKKHG